MTPRRSCWWQHALRTAHDLASPLSQVLQIGTTNYLYGMERLAAQSGSTRTWYGADPRGSGFDLTYGYDGLDRLTSVSAVNLSGPIAHQYDALGRRVGMNDETGTTTWAYDALGRPLSIAQPGGAVGYQYTARGQRRQMTYPGGMQIDYTYLPDGQLDLVRQGTTTLADYSYDALGRMQQVARANGANSA